jgi:hypothetical protein
VEAEEEELGDVTGWVEGDGGWIAPSLISRVLALLVRDARLLVVRLFVSFG